MGLVRVPGNHVLTGVPPKFKRKYDLWQSRLSPQKKVEINAYLMDRLDEIAVLPEKKRIFNASWMPGSEWKEPLLSILTDACLDDQQEAGWCYGLMLRMVIINEDQRDWKAYKDFDDEDKKGTTYFL